MNIPSVVYGWILGILTILVSIGGFVLSYIQDHTLNSTASIIGLIVGIMVVLLNYFTNNYVKAILATLTHEQLNKLRAKHLLQ